jgi:hypothetical protein
MSDEIRLGYQAGVVSLQSPTYGRLWLSVEHHAGDTVSCTQAEALVLAAEKRSGQRPRRRTELLHKRMEAFVQSRAPAEKRLASQQTALAAAQSAQQETVSQWQTETNPKRIAVLERRGVRREKAVEVARKKLSKTQAWLNGHLAQEKALRQRLEQFECENAENPQPLEASFRLDAGFGTYDNIALLIEMGYEVYVKLHNHKIVQMLKKKVTADTAWGRVGHNAGWLPGPPCNCNTVRIRSISLWSVFILDRPKNTALWPISALPRSRPIYSPGLASTTLARPSRRASKKPNRFSIFTGSRCALNRPFTCRKP